MAFASRHITQEEEVIEVGKPIEWPFAIVKGYS